MDLTNKIITVNYISIQGFPAETTVKVIISQEVGTGIFKTLDTYDLKYSQSFLGPEDPALLAAINETLAAI